MKYVTRSNNVWQDEFESYTLTESSPISGITIHEPEDRYQFTGLYDENGDGIYQDNRLQIGFKL